MELLAFGFGIALICGFAATWLYLARIEHLLLNMQEQSEELGKAVERQFKAVESKVIPPAKVSDPFARKKTVTTSTKHIVVPKTPDQIRNENAKKIAEGEEYGYIR
jgi:hypothetical protein